MTATFGKLQGQTLELRDGLNIIEAPNETGKSTWCAFLTAMLYGINSRERDRAGFIAEKNRYAPWAGTAMSGRLDCLSDGRELTITRTTRRQTAPLGEFQAVYAGTGDAVPGLTGQNCGEALLGVGREVFERSAFIRQSGLTVTQDAGLERRIAALITSGQEDTSYTEAADTLKKQLNRRRHNKTGLLPNLEGELSELDHQLQEVSAAEVQLSQARSQARQLEGREAALTEELVQHDRWESAQKRQALTQAETSAREAEEHAASVRRQLETEQIPGNDTIGRLRGAIVNLETVRKSVDKARGERDEAMKALLRAEAAVNESPFAGQTAEQAWKSATSISDSKPWPLSELLPSIFLGIFTLVFYAAQILGMGDGFVDALWGIPCALAALLIPFYKNRKWKQETAAALKKHNVSSAAELREKAVAYADLLKAQEAAQANASAKAAIADALYASLTSNEQGILLEVRRFAPAAYDIPTADALLRQCAVRRRELQEAEASAREAAMRRDLTARQVPAPEEGAVSLTPPTRSRDTVTAALEDVRGQLSAARSTADQLSGRLHAAGDPVVLQSAAACLENQIHTLEAEYDAIAMAMEVLDQANTTLQNRFSPALGRRAAKIFRAMTGDRYGSVTLDRSLHLTAETTADGIYRDAALLSAGTVDQLYLAVRLAICDLVLPNEDPAPIVLDDALSNFDDARAHAALRWLKKAAQDRQILLFTCQSREASFFASDPEVSIQRLTDASEVV